METFLRKWRQDALDKHQYDTAVYVGDKLLALTNADQDAYSLAQTHFSAGNYTRALTFVNRAELLQRSAAAKYLAAQCYIKQDRHEDALVILGDKDPVHLVTTVDSARRKLQHLGNGLTTRQHGKSRLPNHFDRIDRSEDRDLENSENLKYEAGMCFLRGLCYAKQNAFDKAKRCYKNAVRIDVQCFEAFDQLMKNSLMSPNEEWDFVESLNFDTVQSVSNDLPAAQEAADFVRNLYITRLSKYARLEEFTTAIETLSSHYHLADNPDIVLSKAEILFTSSRFDAALQLTSSILESDPYNFACLPLHLALLYQLNHTTTLFALSHDLADTHPNEACTWLAVGTYYMSTNRIPEARSYFSKASLMDPHFGPAWIGFAHTFAAEGECDQAIAAYSTAARLFQGTHLPQMFLGMQEIALDNLPIAREYLTSAYALCDRDPLLINEIGVVAYKEQDYESAVRHFLLSLEIARDNEAPTQQYNTTRQNLAHALRQIGRLPEALDQFDEVIRLGLRDAGVFSAKGLVLLELDRAFDATVACHEALAISPQDPIASDLLNRALAQLEDARVLNDADERAVDVSLHEKLRQIRGERGHGRGPSGRHRVGRARAGHDMDLDGVK